MALGKRKAEQQELWVGTTDLPRSPGHPFYKRLNQLLAEDGFDAWAEKSCAPHYHSTLGRPSIPPGVYLRMVLVGYFEGIASQRGIAWRCCDSRSLAEFLGYGPTEETPDHSSLTRVARRLPREVHEALFQRVLGIAVGKGLVKGKTVAVDSTTLEANAAMKSIVRRDTGDDYQAYLTKLAEAAGLENPTAEALRRFDKNRPDKKVSNDEWESKSDPDSRITKMKDGTTHLAYKAEHVVDLKSEFLLTVTVHGGDAADNETLVDSVMEAEINLQAAGSDTEIEEVAADKGYHAGATLELADSLNLRTYIPEPKRPHRSRWDDKPAELRAAVCGNRRRMKGDRGKRLQRKRSELVERSFAHVCETGGARRCWLRGLEKVTKRYLLQAAARNLGLIMRKLFGIGTPRGLQPEGAAENDLSSLAQLVSWMLQAMWRALHDHFYAPTATARSIAHLDARPALIA
jgi:transposase